MKGSFGSGPRRASDRIQSATRLLARAVTYVDRIACRRHGLTETQGEALRRLWEDGDLLMSELAEDLLIDRSTATRLVDLLEKKSLVRRRASRSDRRQQRVSLTTAGEDTWLTIEDELDHLAEPLRRRLQSLANPGILAALDQIALVQMRRARDLFHSTASEPKQRRTRRRDEPSS